MKWHRPTNAVLYPVSSGTTCPHVHTSNTELFSTYSWRKEAWQNWTLKSILWREGYKACADLVAHSPIEPFVFLTVWTAICQANLESCNDFCSPDWTLSRAIFHILGHRQWTKKDPSHGILLTYKNDIVGSQYYTFWVCVWSVTYTANLLVLTKG